MKATLGDIYLCRTANMSWRTCVVVKQIQSNPIFPKNVMLGNMATIYTVTFATRFVGHWNWNQWVFSSDIPILSLLFTFLFNSLTCWVNGMMYLLARAFRFIRRNVLGISRPESAFPGLKISIPPCSAYDCVQHLLVYSHYCWSRPEIVHGPMLSNVSPHQA